MIIAVREATVGPLLGLVLVSIGAMLMSSYSKPQRFRDNLAKNGVGSLAKFRARNQHPQASCGGRFEADQSIQIAFTGTGKAGAVQKGGHADTFFAAGWCDCERQTW